MNKHEFVQKTAKTTGYSQKQCDAIINAFLSELKADLKQGNRSYFVGLGTFKTSFRAARTAKNPKTGEVIKVKERNTVAFKPCKELKNI